jgi:glycosyltransferase involved in cell wall biosynthesis
LKIKIIHIVSSLEPINIGIWNVVISTMSWLKKYGIEGEIWSKNIGNIPEYIKDKVVLNSFQSNREAVGKIVKMDPSRIIIVTHGNWTYATKVGYECKKNGFIWGCYPHGMLEPWSMNHKFLKKKLYYTFREKGMLKHANTVVAVGYPEYENLSKLLPASNLVHIPNGIDVYEGTIEKSYDVISFLFLARLHRKKRPLSLIQAWESSKLKNEKHYRLIVAGPDEGELPQLKNLCEESGLKNVIISGPLYGEDKTALFLNSHFFILPSVSEGFPTTIVEAMTHGCIPIISRACNFPEAIEESVAFELSYEVDHMTTILEKMAVIEDVKIKKMSSAAKIFADSKYSVEIVADKQQKLYNEILEFRNR